MSRWQRRAVGLGTLPPEPLQGRTVLFKSTILSTVATLNDLLSTIPIAYQISDRGARMDLMQELVDFIDSKPINNSRQSA